VALATDINTEAQHLFGQSSLLQLKPHNYFSGAFSYSIVIKYALKDLCFGLLDGKLDIIPRK
jgi:hypothetical protein